MIRIQDNTIRDGMQQSNVRKSLIIKKEVLKQINKLNINYICLFNYLFISSQMSAKPYFIGSTGILLLW